MKYLLIIVLMVTFVACKKRPSGPSGSATQSGQSEQLQITMDVLYRNKDSIQYGVTAITNNGTAFAISAAGTTRLTHLVWNGTITPASNPQFIQGQFSELPFTYNDSIQVKIYINGVLKQSMNNDGSNQIGLYY